MIAGAVTGTGRRTPFWQAGLILLVGLLTLAPGTGRLPLQDRDEPRFAQAAVEMIARGDWIVPTFNGRTRYDKPVLTYWLMRAGYALCGVGEWGARLHSVAATLLLALTVWALGRRMGDGAAGLQAALMLLVSAQILINGRAATADMPLILCVALTQWALFELLRPGASFAWGWWACLYVAAGVGFLAKGPLAWLVPVVSLALWRWVFGRRPLPWRNLRAGLGLPLVLLIAGGWGIPALVRTQGAFWESGMHEHVVHRGLAAWNNRPYLPVVFYVIALPLSAFPWVGRLGHLGPVWRAARDPETGFLLAWWLTPYLIFAFYATQLPHYVLPGFPAMYLLLARHGQQAAPRGWRWWRWGLNGAVGLMAAAWLGLAFVPAADGPHAPLRRVFLGVAAMLAGLLLAGAGWDRRRRVIAAGGVILIALGMGWVGAGARLASPAVHLAPLYRSMPPDTEFLAMDLGYAEGTLVFYSNARWRMLGDPAELARRLALPGPRLALFPIDRRDAGDALRAWRQGRPDDPPRREPATAWPPGLTPEAVTALGYRWRVVEGLVPERGAWVHLMAVYRGAP